MGGELVSAAEVAPSAVSAGWERVFAMSAVPLQQRRPPPVVLVVAPLLVAVVEVEEVEEGDSAEAAAVAAVAPGAAAAVPAAALDPCWPSRSEHSGTVDHRGPGARVRRCL